MIGKMVSLWWVVYRISLHTNAGPFAATGTGDRGGVLEMS